MAAEALFCHLIHTKMKTSKALKQEQLSGVITKVLAVFQEINKVQNATKVQLFEFVQLFKENHRHFQQGWEVAYLKIFKIFHQRANRRMPHKFQKLATDFFNEILPSKEQSALAFFDSFIEFLAEAVFSSLLGIRTTAARMLFHLLKAHQDVNNSAKEKVLKAVFFLVRLRVSTYKQIGIKLASIILGWEGASRDKIEDEMFKSMATDENEQIRKLAMTNLWIKGYNLDRVLIRLRDKCVDIRNIILKKLISQRYPLQQTTIFQRYRILYDGFGNKESSVQQETVKYFFKFFDKADPSQTFFDFVNFFHPDTLLAYPQLYTLFDLLIIDLIQELPINQISDFIRKFTGQLRAIGKGAEIQGSLKELIWLKNIGRSENSELRTLFEESVPTGMELAKILQELMHKEDASGLYECLQLFSLQKSADEIGRNKMFDSLKKVVIELDYWSIKREINPNSKDDICPNLTEQELKKKKMLLNFYDLPPVSCSFDLLFEVGRAMRALWPDHYEIQLKELMADWNNPEENNLFKERQLAEMNVKKVQGHADNELMNALKAKFDMIEEQIQRQNAKTLIVIQTIIRLKPSSTMDDYMMIVRKQLAKRDQTQGLLLLGYYCYEEQDRSENFLPLYWANIVSSEASKLGLLISLKVTTDFFTKFDFTQFVPGESSEDIEAFDYGQYLRKMQHFAIQGDPDTKILAIEGICRLIFNNRVPDECLGSCFMRILLLWWETSSEEVSARSVHTISVFIKQFIEKGQRQVRKLSEWLCVFFKMILTTQTSRRMINKKKIVYNLKVEEFIKRAIIIAMTVLKYQKESRQVIWRYQEAGAELGPQELFLIFMFKHKEFHFCLQKALNICDFYEEAPLETLILVKKHIETLLEEGNFVAAKKLQGSIKKIEAELEERIQVINKETFNETLLDGLKQQLHEYEMLIDSVGTSLEMELRDEQIFIDNPDAAESQNQQPSEQHEEQVDVAIDNMDDLVQSQDPKHQKKSEKRVMNRISQHMEDDDNESSVSYIKKEEDSHPKKPNRKRRMNNSSQERQPVSAGGESESVVEARKNKIISGRTRSRLHV